jgi:hypothetical protein
MQGRVDLDKYRNGMNTCLNGVPVMQGPWTRRPGTAFMHGVKDNAQSVRLIPFRHNSGNDYILEFGVNYIRIFNNQAITVNTGQSVTSITLASPGVVTKTAHGYSDGDRLELYDFVGALQLNGREIIVANKTANDFELTDSDGTAIDTTAYTAFTSGNMAEIYEVVTLFEAVDLPDLHFTQTADALYIFHVNHEPVILTRTSAADWTLSAFTTSDGPYLETNATTTTITPSAAVNGADVTITGAVDNGAGLIRITAGSHGLTTGDVIEIEDVLGTIEANFHWRITTVNANEFDLDASAFVNAYISGGIIEPHVELVASAITGINGDTGFAAGDVGRLIRMQEGSAWGWAEIVYFESTTVVHAHVYDTFTNTNAKLSWRLGAWSDTTGWPRTGAFLENRLWLGGPTDNPQRVDGSRSGLYTTFSPSDLDGTVPDDAAIDYPLNADDLHAVRWLSPTSRGLAIGTSRGEWLLSAGSTTAEVITPSNATARPSTYHGSDTTQPVKVGSATLFAQRGSRKIREFAYLYETDDFTAPDMTLVAEHILRPGTTQHVQQQIPHTIIWSVRSDGDLLGFTYERAQNVTAWHRHTLGGFSDSGNTAAAKVEALALIPSADGTRDELYVQTDRYIDGGTRRTIEYMTKFWETTDSQDEAVHLDNAWTQLSSPASDTITQLHHLEGESVQIYADGARYPDQTVSNGLLTISQTASILTVGYGYNSDGENLPLEGGSQDGSSASKIRRIHRVGFNLLDTLGLKFGPDENNLQEALVAEWGFTYGVAVPLFTGIVRKRFESDYGLYGQVYWRVDGPFPATVLAIMPQANVSDDT